MSKVGRISLVCRAINLCHNVGSRNLIMRQKFSLNFLIKCVVMVFLLIVRFYSFQTKENFYSICWINHLSIVTRKVSSIGYQSPPFCRTLRIKRQGLKTKRQNTLGYIHRTSLSYKNTLSPGDCLFLQP